MAIFVSNTAAPVFAPPLSEGTDPNLPGLETAFTEELAAVRRLPDADAEAHVSAPALKEDEKKEDTADLQILPANVLVNAVTDANFAYALQGQVVQPGVPVGVAVSPEVSVGMSETAETAGALGGVDGVGSVAPMGGANVPLVSEQPLQGLANPSSNLVSPVNQNEQAAKFENAAPQATNPSDLKTQVATSHAKESAPIIANTDSVGMALAKGSTDASSLAANFASEPSFDAVQSQAKLDLVSSQSIQDQHETTLSAPKSFEDLSSSFVSSLVGGAPRPMATVMDLTALQSQDKTTPVTPHEARLDAGTIHMEIQRMVKQGGGHVVMEITPPDQSKFTIELKMDTQGNARLIVEGVSDSTRTRLEQSAPQLREQFQQMGMELQLDMRQQRDSGSQNAQNQDGPSERAPWMAQQADLKLPAQRATAASRALESGANQVYLYA
jgi:hypothetical protein